MLLNTGTEIVPSKNGLLTTCCYKIGDQPAVYCLEGSIAITGALVQWLRDNLKLIEKAPDVEALARTVEDNGGIYFVPAFSGLFAPYWKSDARGVIVGLTRYINRGHIARAALEATAFQTREVLDAMNADSGVPLTALKVDGGMVYNELLMKFQADVSGRASHSTPGSRNHGAGRCVRRGPGCRLLEECRRPAGNWGVDKTGSLEDERPAQELTKTGRKQSPARSIGLNPEGYKRSRDGRFIGPSNGAGRDARGRIAANKARAPGVRQSSSRSVASICLSGFCLRKLRRPGGYRFSNDPRPRQ